MAHGRHAVAMKTEIKTAFLIIPFALIALLLSLGCGNGPDERADAGCEDPSEFVSEMAEVTGEGNRCLSYAECAAALTDKTAANDNINYEGVSGPIDF